MCSEPSAILILDVQAEGLKTGTPSSSSIPITIASPRTAGMHKSTSRHAQGHHLHAAAHCPQHFSATITPSTPPAPPFDHIAETLTVPYILGLAFWEYPRRTVITEKMLVTEPELKFRSSPNVNHPLYTSVLELDQNELQQVAALTCFSVLARRQSCSVSRSCAARSQHVGEEAEALFFDLDFPDNLDASTIIWQKLDCWQACSEPAVGVDDSRGSLPGGAILRALQAVAWQRDALGRSDEEKADILRSPEYTKEYTGGQSPERHAAELDAFLHVLREHYSQSPKSFVDLHSLLGAKQPNVSQRHPSRNADSSLVSYEHPEFVHEQELTNNAFSHQQRRRLHREMFSAIQMSQMAQQKLIQIWKGLLSYIAVAGLNEAKHDVSSFQYLAVKDTDLEHALLFSLLKLSIAVLLVKKTRLAVSVLSFQLPELNQALSGEQQLVPSSTGRRGHPNPQLKEKTCLQ
ncbi:hypothetical protein Anapl_02343 [Anas platyrhynchos]|uniref:Uncharacterized protein n=1 Tax=Anas platyrhynchos TaxID=8839 RepID=R0JVG1_ANAPL|nr:hypothetical protein Anapl_02343 [Anas platyrhynchos]